MKQQIPRSSQETATLTAGRLQTSAPLQPPLPVFSGIIGRIFCSVFETSCAALHSIPDQIRPHELDHPSIVVAVRQIVIQGRKTMLLAGFLHAGELAVIEFVVIDASPIVGRRVHREAGCDGPVGSDDDIVLTGPAVPLGKAQLAVSILDDSGSVGQATGNVSITAAAISVPTQPLQVCPTRHSDEGLDFLQSLHRIDHLVAGLVLFNQPIDQRVDLEPVLGPGAGYQQDARQRNWIGGDPQCELELHPRG